MLCLKLTTSIIRLFIIVTLQLYLLQSYGQKINYPEIHRTLLKAPKNQDDTLPLLNNILNLEKIDTHQIRKNFLKDYYSDLGKSYWLLAHGKNKIAFQQKAFATYSKALFYAPHDHRVLWFFALWYAYHNDCVKAKFYMDSFKKHSDKKKWNTECIAFAEAQCQ